MTPKQPPLKKPMIVSIHDVRPGLFEQTATMRRLLADQGVDKASLLVIPHHHRSDPLEACAPLLTWLAAQAHKGDELTLHALYHKEDPQPKSRGLMEYYRSQIHTSGEGEFFRLNKVDAAKRIAQGLALFKRLGISTSGFVAPAWLYSSASVEALRACGLEYYTTIDAIHRLDPPTRIPSWAVVWSYRAPWRYLSNAFLPWIARVCRMRNPVFRVALHPPDFGVASIQRRVMKIIREALRAGFTPTTYRDFLASHHQPQGWTIGHQEPPLPATRDNRQ